MRSDERTDRHMEELCRQVRVLEVMESKRFHNRTNHQPATACLMRATATSLLTIGVINLCKQVIAR